MNIEHIKELSAGIAAKVGGKRISIMEVCGTHTVAILRHGIRSLLPPTVRLLSGPGCPVCVTPQGFIDAACGLARRQDLVVCTYGDMLRVPGSDGSLADMRADGARVMVVNSLLDAVRLSKEDANRNYVFLAVGFETTAPATAAAVMEARSQGLRNFSVLASHRLVIPAMRTLLESGDVLIDGFICPGHVSVIIGSDAYLPIAEKYHKPCVVAGFEPAQILSGILRIVTQIADGRSIVENVYGAVARPQGNPVARGAVETVFEESDAEWRGLGIIPRSGLALRPEFKEFDASRRFSVIVPTGGGNPACRCGDVLSARIEPPQCPLFGKTCTPTDPLGPCMVSSEGTCAAYHRFKQFSPRAQNSSRNKSE